jgi:hypothetical protein
MSDSVSGLTTEPVKTEPTLLESPYGGKVQVIGTELDALPK